jgi:hypothetical protein
MSPRRKKSLKKKSKRKSIKNKTDQGKNKNIDNKIKRQSKIIAVLEQYIKDINNLEKIINNIEKNKVVKKIKSIRKNKNSKIRHDIPFDVSMIKPNYQKTKRTMIEEQKKKTMNQQPIFYGYDDLQSSYSLPPTNIIYSSTPSKKSRTKIPESAKLAESNSPKFNDRLSIINESSDESFNTPSSSSSESSSFSETPSSSRSSSDSESSSRINLMNRLGDE